jgi:hypothetical protein
MGTTDLDLLNVLVASLAFGRCRFILILLSCRIKNLALPEAHDSREINAKGAISTEISPGADAFVEVEKPHALVRSVIPTY